MVPGDFGSVLVAGPARVAAAGSARRSVRCPDAAQLRAQSHIVRAHEATSKSISLHSVSQHRALF